ncbi:hypothetical protein KC19_9G046400 [Ceratodon purpureus]|uniref:Protein kinase domain-containing protein n=1 Tax=Ceratodon purpureus TaxID=3225 RepID=A0A8T0GU66_CERPU|nr:hypothetical protein KC19_9G046400 [Ceratodon purpureus]
MFVCFCRRDLSGNRLNGFFPIFQISAMHGLQTLNLGRNDFEGGIPSLAFENMTQLDHLDLSNNRFTGYLPELTMIKNLQILDVSSNKFMGSLPDLTNLPSLQTVNLSRNEFTGSFELATIYKASVSTSLSVLDLSGNQLTRDLTVWNISELGSLQELYLDNNFITGTLDIIHLYKSGLFQMNSTNSSGSLRLLSLSKNNITHVNYDVRSIEDIKTVIRLQDNPYCNGTSNDGTRCFCEQICFNSGSALKEKTRKIIIISTVSSGLSVLVLLAIGFAIIFHRNRRYKQYLMLQAQQKFEEFDVKPTIYTYNELRIATRDFHPDVKLGEGGYGAVYKGTLPNGKLLAVKRLFAMSTQGIDEFLNEVVLITGMRHRNLVNLKGCCLHETQRLLVYEYVDNFDVDQILLAGPRKVLLSWPVRLRICLGVARGLHYLHDLAQPRIMHRDIKAKNILLDRNYEAKIADFGLALLFSDEQTHITTKHVAGTKGYLAPEYALLGQMNDKVDVFSFGVLCLEVVCGRRNMDERLRPDMVYLVKWAWKLHEQGRLLNLVDPTLVLQDDEKPQVQRLINTALLCVQHTGERRPSIARVVSMLQGDADLELVGLSVGQYLPHGQLLKMFFQTQCSDFHVLDRFAGKGLYAYTRPQFPKMFIEV